MSRFIYLSKRIINTYHIEQILINENKYKIYFGNHYFNGYIFCGSGTFNSIDNFITVCKEKDPVDYEIVRKWTYNNY